MFSGEESEEEKFWAPKDEVSAAPPGTQSYNRIAQLSEPQVGKATSPDILAMLLDGR